MNRQTSVRSLLLAMVIVAAALFPAGAILAEGSSVPLPKIENERIEPRVIYIENPRFPKVSQENLHRVYRSAAVLVRAHFGLTMENPGNIATRNIDHVFSRMAARERPRLDEIIGDFKSGNVDWDRVRGSLVKQIKKQKDLLAKQIAFARPYLTEPLATDDLDSFVRAVTATFKARLTHWTTATLADGHPVIGSVPGRPDLPINEWVYWSLMAKRGIEAEIILTTQLVASVEYVEVPVHTSLRGGITGGSTEYNPSSQFGSSVWVSLFPYLSEDPQIRELRGGRSYTRDQALRLAGAMLAHEMGHQLFHLGHPWSNEACVMRPAEALDFAAWIGKFDAERCRIGSSPAMTPGALKIPVW